MGYVLTKRKSTDFSRFQGVFSSRIEESEIILIRIIVCIETILLEINHSREKTKNLNFGITNRKTNKINIPLGNV